MPGEIQIVDTVKQFIHSRPGNELREVWGKPATSTTVTATSTTCSSCTSTRVVSAFQRGEPPPIRAGRRALLLAHAYIRSFEEHREVSVT